jgi:hypothetical protein
MDGARATVGGVDHEGFAWCETNAKGYLTGPVERVLWREVEHLGETRWRILPVETETPAAKAKREKATKPKRAKAAPKARPARLEEVPEADAIAQSCPGTIVIVWQVAEGAAWERVWSEPSPKAAAIESAWQAACEAHRARQYNRGGRCTRDSQDGAA